MADSLPSNIVVAFGWQGLFEIMNSGRMVAYTEVSRGAVGEVQVCW
jgi:hypothetical protein